MTARSACFVTVLALAACAPIRYEREVSPLEPAAEAGAAPSYDLPVPKAPPMREAYTSYHRIVADTGAEGGKEVVGYAVRYEAPPAAAKVERSYPTGTVFLEDREFRRIGFLTNLGRGYRYRGATPEEVGQGTVEELLPQFFGGSSFELTSFE